MKAASKPEPGVGTAVTFTRHVAAPREQVFALWTKAEHLAKWWGPAGFTNPVCELDARPGGRITIDMTAPDGTVYPMEGVVEEILPPQRLFLRCTCCGDDSGEPGLESLTTVLFTADPGGRSEEHKSDLQSLLPTSSAVLCLEQKIHRNLHLT